MTGLYGGDVEQLRRMARTFNSSANHLDQERLEVGSSIRIRAWFGPAAVEFRLRWDSEHSQRIVRAADALREAGECLRRNAEEQERASAAAGGSIGGNGRTAGGYAPYPPPKGVTVTGGARLGDTEPVGAADPGGLIEEFAEDGAYESGIRIRTIYQADGSKSYIVYIPGTQDWWSNSPNVFDGVDNVGAAAGNPTKATHAILEAMRLHGIAADEPIMLVGHSQGSLIAGNLAAEPTFRSRYNVQGVLGFGADISSLNIPDSVHVTQVSNVLDPVPTFTRVTSIPRFLGNRLGGGGVENLNDIVFADLDVTTITKNSHAASQASIAALADREYGEAAKKAVEARSEPFINAHTNYEKYSEHAMRWYSKNEQAWNEQYSSFQLNEGAWSDVAGYEFAE